MIPTLRTLTRKSKIGFGKNKDLTIQKHLDLNKKISLISAYYNLTSINFTEDILSELNIPKEFRIDKPGANKEMYYKMLNTKGYKKNNSKSGADILKKYSKNVSNSYLQRYNQGKN